MQYLCFGLNTLFRGTEVAKMVSHQMHRFYSMGLKIMFGSVLEQFGNLRNLRDAILVFSGLNDYFGVPKLRNWFHTKFIHWTPLDPKWCWECLGAFRKPSECKEMQYLCFGPECLFRGTEVAKMVSHQMHPLDTIRPKMMLWVFSSNSETFGM